MTFNIILYDNFSQQKKNWKKGIMPTLEGPKFKKKKVYIKIYIKERGISQKKKRG